MKNIWYWLWVHFTDGGRNFDLFHKTTQKDREEISKKLSDHYTN